MTTKTIAIMVIIIKLIIIIIKTIIITIMIIILVVTLKVSIFYYYLTCHGNEWACSKEKKVFSIS